MAAPCGRPSAAALKRLLLLLLVVLLTNHYASASPSLSLPRRLLLSEQAPCPCDEIYTVQDGDTLQLISTNCHAPLLLLDNPHIQDSDDVAPGMHLKITCLPAA